MDQGDAAPTLNQRVAAGVRAELARHGMSQAKLARHLGLSLNSLRRRMNDEISFTVDEADLICQLFDVQPNELIRLALAHDAIRIIAHEVIVEKG